MAVIRRCRRARLPCSGPSRGIEVVAQAGNGGALSQALNLQVDDDRSRSAIKGAGAAICPATSTTRPRGLTSSSLPWARKVDLSSSAGRRSAEELRAGRLTENLVAPGLRRAAALSPTNAGQLPAPLCAMTTTRPPLTGGHGLEHPYRSVAILTKKS